MLCTFLTIHHIKSSCSACRLPPWRFLKCSPCQIRTKRLAAWISNKQEKALCSLVEPLWFLLLIWNSWATAVFPVPWEWECFPWHRRRLWAALRVPRGHLCVGDERNPSRNLRSVLEHSSPMLLYGVFSCFRTHARIFEVIWSFVVLKSFADLVTLDCALCERANKDLQNAFHCATKV